MNIFIICLLLFIFLQGCNQDQDSSTKDSMKEVAALIKVADEQEAIHTANDTVFGLGAAVFTRDVKHGEHIAARQLKAGCCFVNDYVKSNPLLPFGGIKQSGYGRELGEFGIREFVNVKTVYIK